MSLLASVLATFVLLAQPVDQSSLDERIWRYERAADGRLLSTRDPLGRVTSLTYNAENQLESIRQPSGELVHYTYTANGLRESMTDGLGRTTYEYDAMDMLAVVHHPFNHTLRYRFDLEQRLRRIELDDWIQAYEYDLMGRLSNVQTPLGKITFHYDPARKANGISCPQTIRSLPNGVQTTWTFNADMQLASLRHDKGELLLAGWEYERDSVGRIKAVKDLPTGTVRHYDYDPLGRLTQIVERDQPVEQYLYDLGSNPVEIVHSGITQEATYDKFGLLVTAGDRRYEFDRTGEMTRRDFRGGRSTSFRFASAGRLSSAIDNDTAIEYRYDGDGNLVERRKGEDVRQFVNDIAATPARVIAVFEKDKVPAMKFVFAPHRVAAQDRAGKAYYYLEDHLQSVRLVVDSQGGVVDRLDYSAFGDRRPEAELNTPCDFGFTGQWYDPDTGLVHFHARWYEPETARFISSDPLIGVLTDPTSFNRYLYTGGDPINRLDPDGCEWMGIKMLYPVPIRFSPPPPPPPPPLQRRSEDYWILQPLRNRPFSLTQEEVRTQTRVNGVDISFGVSELFEIPRVEKLLRKVGIELPPHIGDVVDYNATLKFRSLGLPKIEHGVDVPGWVPKLSKDYGKNFFSSPPLNKTFVETVDFNANPFSAIPFVDRAPILGNIEIPVTHRTERTTVYNQMGQYVNAQLREHSARHLPVFSAPTPPSTHVPNVGGVYLDGLASILGDMRSVRGVHFDHATGALVFLADGASKSTTHLRAEDLAVAFQAALEDNWPGVSIDPQNNDPSGKLMDYRYIGPTAQRRFGQVMGEADLLMKFIGMGEDNSEDRNKVRPKINGFRDFLELSFEIEADKNKQVQSRFWLVPGRIEWQVSPDGKTLWCKKAEIKVNTQVQELVGGRLVDAIGKSDPAAEAFARYFSNHYDELAKEYPVYEDLRELAALVGLVKWLREKMPPEDFARLATSFVPVVRETPATTPSLHVSRTKQTKDATSVRTQTLTVNGGVNLTPQLPSQIPQDPALSGIRFTPVMPAADPTLPYKADVNSATRKLQTLSIPPLARVALGNFTAGATDLSVPIGQDQALSLTRYYRSGSTSDGVLGRGWRLSLPEVRFESTGSRTSIYLTDGLETYRQRLGYVDARAVMTALNNGRQVDFRDEAGAHWHFGPDRRVARCNNGDDEWSYEYDGSRLRQASFARQGQLVARITLKYDSDGYLDSAQDNLERAVRFQYDAQKRLVGVDAGQATTEYSYTDDHRLASIRSPSGSRTFRYDSAGNLAADVDDAGHGQTYERWVTDEGGIRLETTHSKNLKTGVVYDPAGHVRRLTCEGRTLDRNFEDNLQVLTLKTGNVPVAELRYDASQNTIENIVPGESREQIELDKNGIPRRSTIESVTGSRMATEYDEYGNLVSMSDPDGGEFRLTQAGNRQQEIVTPVGTYMVASDEQGRRVSMKFPSGKVREWGYSDDDGDEPTTILERGPGYVQQLKTVKPNHWELTADNQPVATLTADAHGRITEFHAPFGATVKAQYSENGSVIRLPDHRQVAIKRDADGRILEVREYPRNSPPATVPKRDGVSTLPEK